MPCVALIYALLNMVSQGELFSEQLYHIVEQCIREHLHKHLDQAATVDKSTAVFYHQWWVQCDHAGSRINKLFQYLNRHWVARERDSSEGHVDDIYQMHISLWKQVVVANMPDDVRIIFEPVEESVTA